VTRTETTDTVHRAAIMGQTRSVSHATAFQGGDLTAIMGQADLDLTQAVVAPGDTPVLNVFVVMGQASVRVPDDWIVDTRAVPALGNVHDIRPDQSGDAAGRPHLVIRGAVTMGQLVVKD
jgi:predicted membrane protein